MSLPALSRRERQIMDALHRHGKATAAEVQESIVDPPSYSTVRSLLTTLVGKGHALQSSDGVRYLYQPAISRETGRRRAVEHLVSTFFADEPDAAFATLLRVTGDHLTETDYHRLRDMIDQARTRGPAIPSGDE
ncbi:MAG: BlaI/MecI/CopY family transcriptional regulator [Bacteroidota bacterium]